MRPGQQLAAPASNWLRQPPLTTTDVRHSGPKAGAAMARTAALSVHPTDRLVRHTPAIQALRRADPPPSRCTRPWR